MSDKPRRARQRIDLRIRVRANDLESFVAQQSRFVDGDRIFIFTAAPLPVGSPLSFALQLENGENMLRGCGVVRRSQTDEPTGMEVSFVAIDQRSELVHDLMRREAAARKSPAAPPPPEPNPDGVPQTIEVADEITRRVSAVLATAEAPIQAGAEAPHFADAWQPEPLVPESNTVPVNPFEGVTEGAIDYFVEWSIGSSTTRAASPSVTLEVAPLAEAAKPQATHSRPSRWAHVAGFALGLAAAWLVVEARAPVAPAMAATVPPPVCPVVQVSTDPPSQLARLEDPPPEPAPVLVAGPVRAHHHGRHRKTSK